jgi:hypothetical protein
MKSMILVILCRTSEEVWPDMQVLLLGQSLMGCMRVVGSSEAKLASVSNSKTMRPGRKVST